MVRFLVEHGACIFATTLSDHETAAEKCEEDEEGFDGCSEYLYSRSLHSSVGSCIVGEQDAVHSQLTEKSSHDNKFVLTVELLCGFMKNTYLLPI